MANKFKVFTYYKNKAIAAPVDDDVKILAAGKTVAIKGVSFTAPGNGKCAALILWNGAIFEAGQSDKFVAIDNFPVEGDGVKQLIMRLDNSTGVVAAFLGVTIYYEDLG